MKTQATVSHKYEVLPRLLGTGHLEANSEIFSASALSIDGYSAEETLSTNYVQGLEGDRELGISQVAPLTPLRRVCSCFFKLSWKSNLFLAIFICATLVMLLLVAAPGVCPHIAKAVKPLSDPTSKGIITDATKKEKNFNILFYGDSMLSAPIQRYDLMGRISRYLPSYQFTGKASAYSGVRMINLRKNLPQNLPGTPRLDGIIIMCDSDITDIKFYTLTEQEKASLLSAYTADLLFVIHAAQNASIPIAISSPVGVLLEGRLGAPDSIRYHHKVQATAAYIAATKAAAESTSVPYIDIHSATLAAIPYYRQYYLGCVTYDGEHPNGFGTEIFAKLYAQVLIQWFYSSLMA